MEHKNENINKNKHSSHQHHKKDEHSNDISKSASVNEEKENKSSQKPKKSVKKHIRYVIFKGIMNYSLLVGFVLGLLAVFLGIFESSFLALNLFLIMMGTIYSIFNIKSNKHIFQEFMMMIGTIVFVALLLTYITSTSNLIPMSDTMIGNIFRTLQYILSIFVSLFMVPCIVSVFKLIFLNKKSEE